MNREHATEPDPDYADSQRFAQWQAQQTIETLVAFRAATDDLVRQWDVMLPLVTQWVHACDAFDETLWAIMPDGARQVHAMLRRAVAQ